MEYIEVLRDSIETSISMKFFKDINVASYYHIFMSKYKKISLSWIKKNLQNINPIRFTCDPYPKNNRPRGKRDISSIKHKIKQLQNKENLTPIWIIHKNGVFTLLDGAHRIVAHNLLNKRYINAFIIQI
jgi:hypothetical protein